MKRMGLPIGFGAKAGHMVGSLGRTAFGESVRTRVGGRGIEVETGRTGKH